MKTKTTALKDFIKTNNEESVVLLALSDERGKRRVTFRSERDYVNERPCINHFTWKSREIKEFFDVYPEATMSDFLQMIYSTSCGGICTEFYDHSMSDDALNIKVISYAHEPAKVKVYVIDNNPVKNLLNKLPGGEYLFIYKY